jgi:hypothetical protein
MPNSDNAPCHHDECDEATGSNLPGNGDHRCLKDNVEREEHKNEDRVCVPFQVQVNTHSSNDCITKVASSYVSLDRDMNRKWETRLERKTEPECETKASETTPRPSVFTSLPIQCWKEHLHSVDCSHHIQHSKKSAYPNICLPLDSLDARVLAGEKCIFIDVARLLFGVLGVVLVCCWLVMRSHAGVRVDVNKSGQAQ